MDIFLSLICNIGTANAASSLTLVVNATLRQDNSFIALKMTIMVVMLLLQVVQLLPMNKQYKTGHKRAISGVALLNAQVITWSHEGFKSATEISGNAVVNGNAGYVVNYDGGTRFLL